MRRSVPRARAFPCTVSNRDPGAVVIVIDGSEGEGGGQVLRTALSLALAGGGSFTTATLTGHARTNARLIERFLTFRFRFDELGGERWRITLAST